MRNDDFQVLGVERKKRQRYRWLVVMLTVVAVGIAVGLGVYWATSPKTVRTGKRMGDSTIVPEPASSSRLAAQCRTDSDKRSAGTGHRDGSGNG